MAMTKENKKMLQYAGGGVLAAYLGWNVLQRWGLEAKLTKAASRCRRTTQDLLTGRGASPTDAANQALEYCGTEGGGAFSKDVP